MKFIKTGKSLIIGTNMEISEKFEIGSHTVIESNAIIYENVKNRDYSSIISGVIFDELNYKEVLTKSGSRMTAIGDNSIIGLGTIIYSATKIGSNFRFGNIVVIIEDEILLSIVLLEPYQIFSENSG